MMIVIPLLLSAAAAYFLYRLLRKKIKDIPEKTDRELQEEKVRQKRSDLAKELQKDLHEGRIPYAPGTDQYELPEKYEPIRDLWDSVQKIVNEINFFEHRVSIQNKVGEREIPSNIPTGNTRIITMQQIGDLPKALSSELLLEDDMFYQKLATNNILMQQSIEYEGIYEEKYIRRKKTLRMLQDISGSTKGARIAWSQILNFLLMKKARKARAEESITTFTEQPRESVHAGPAEPASYEQMRHFIDSNLQAGGGTNINNAIMYEFERIESENKELDVEQSAQIVLITDGTEGVDVDVIGQKLKENKVTLHTVILGTSNKQLKSVSSRFHFLDVPQEED